jgi:hypothetical protein
MQHLDNGMEPNGNEPENNTEEILNWVINNYTPAELYGEEIYEKPAMDFYKWILKSDWALVNGRWFNWDTKEYVTDQEMFQTYLKEPNTTSNKTEY